MVLSAARVHRHAVSSVGSEMGNEKGNVLTVNTRHSNRTCPGLKSRVACNNKRLWDANMPTQPAVSRVATV